MADTPNGYFTYIDGPLGGVDENGNGFIQKLQTFQTAADAALDTIVGAPGSVGLTDPGSNGMLARTALGVTAARTLTAPAAGFTISNGNGVSGNPTFVLANDLAALEGLSGTGFAKRTGTDAWAVGALVVGDIPPAGSSGQVQFNDGGVLGAEAGFEYDKAANTLSAFSVSATNMDVSNIDGTQAGFDNIDAATLLTAGAIETATYIRPILPAVGLSTTTLGDVTRPFTSVFVDKIGSLTSNGFVKTSGGDGTLSVDTNTYLTGNQTITLSGDVSGSGTTAITTAIGASKVTNAMLAGSIAASKLVGTDIATVGTLTAGATGAGFTVALSTSTITGTLADARLSSNVAMRNAANSFAGHQTPSATDTYDLGSATLLWRKGWLSELDAVLFAQNTVSVIGGWLLVSKDEGTVDEDVDTSETQIDFGTNAIVANDFIVFRAAGAVEYMQATSLVGGNVWNVTRDLDGSGANAWPQGSVWVNFGYNGTGRIELNANATPRLSMMRQGTSYNTQSEIVRIGDLNGWSADYVTETYGVAIGSPTDSWVKIDPANGVRLGFDSGNVTIDSDGITIEAGVLDINKIAWESSSLRVAELYGNATGLHSAILHAYGASASAASGVVIQPLNTNGLGPAFTLVVGGSSHATLPSRGQAILGSNSLAFDGFLVRSGAFTSSEPATLLHLSLDDAATNVFTDLVTVAHISGGTPAANFGSSFVFKLESSTTLNRDAGRFGYLWTTATDASRTSAFVIQTVNNAGSLAEVARFAGNGDAKVTGVIIAGSGPTTITDSTGKVLGSALEANPTITTSLTIAGGTATGTLNLDGGSGGGANVSQVSFNRTGSGELSRIEVVRSGANDAGDMQFYTKATGGSLTNRMTLGNGGGLVIGSPTGGNKGNGTINATAVYDDNVLLTDWVFDLHYDGSVKSDDEFFKAHPWQRLYSLSESAVTTETERRLPWMPLRKEFESERNLGGMVSRLWQGQEQQQLYILELEARIAKLENQRSM